MQLRVSLDTTPCCQVSHDSCCCTSRKETKVRFHQSSVMSPAPNMLGTHTHQKAVNQLPTDWLVYEEMTRAHRYSWSHSFSAFMLGEERHSKQIAILLISYHVQFSCRSAQVKTCTVVSPITIAVFAGPAKLPPDYIKDAESGGSHPGQHCFSSFDAVCNLARLCKPRNDTSDVMERYISNC